MIKITDEMFKVAIGAYVGHAESAEGLHAAIEAVAPMIARAENEACDKALEQIASLQSVHPFIRDGYSDGIQTARRTIRARFKTASEPKSEE